MTTLGAIVAANGHFVEERLQALAAALGRPGSPPPELCRSADGRAAFAVRARPHLAEDHGPFAADQGAGITLAFDGVLHNGHELRSELRARGIDTGSGRPAELALGLWRSEGPAGLRRLRGPWAVALYEAATGRLVAGRGPFGLRPLFGMRQGEHLLLASRLRALCALHHDLRPDPVAEAAFLVWGAVPEPRTPVDGIFALRPGRLRRWGPALAELPEEVVLDVPTLVAECSRERVDVPVGDARAAVRNALHETLRAHMQDGDPAVLVGGGGDAAALFALAGETGSRQPTAVTVGLRERAGAPGDPVAVASAAAAAAGARHVIDWRDESELAAAEAAIVAALDQPAAHGLMLGFAARAAREAGLPVVMAAIGGDELFGATPAFDALPRWRRWTRLPSRLPVLPRLWQQAMERLPPRLQSSQLAGMLRLGASEAALWTLHEALHQPWELGAWVGEEAAMRGLLTAHPLDEAAAMLAAEPAGEWSRIAALELGLGLRLRSLRSAADLGAAHGVEVRLPLVDATLWRRVLPIMAAYAPARKRWLLEAPRTPVAAPAGSGPDPAATLAATLAANWAPNEAPADRPRAIARRVWRLWWDSLSDDR